VVASHDLGTLNTALNSSYLDLTVPTDSRPFFFNQLRLFSVPSLWTILQMRMHGHMEGGVLSGNLMASAVLLMIFCLSVLAVVLTIVLPLKLAARRCPRPLAVSGSLYFSLIGMGFMLTEIALIQYFSVYLGHPIYSLGVCLFSLILASGMGSLASTRLRLDTGRLLVWAALASAYLVVLVRVLPGVFAATTNRERTARIAIALASILPLGFLLGFGFPTGMRLVETVDRKPTPWFWGINGATGVLASALGVMLSMAFGIDVTLLIAAGCYLLLMPVSLSLMRLGRRTVVAA
jgi:hypothetical protein